ncbi:MAG: tetratricopeptide repeat protein [Terracidiphilus sp.]
MKRSLCISGLLIVVCIASTNIYGRAQTADNNPAATTGFGSDANFNQTLNQQVGSMRFVGRVVMAGGKLPWDPIPVAVICDGKTRFNTVTDRKGEFNIQASYRESEAVATKRDPKHISPAEFVGCKVRAILDGFESTTVTIANGSITDSPDLGTITLRPSEAGKGSVLSTTTLSAPAEAQKEFDKAFTDEIEKHLDSARKHLQKAVSIDPQFAEAWYQLGKLEETDKPQDAMSAYQKAAAADPNYTPPYERIAALAANQKKWKDVVDATDHALQLNPAGTPQIWYFNAVGNLNIGHTDVAETSAETSLSMDPSHVAPNTEQLLAVIEAGRGQYKDALDHLRHCLTYTPPGPNADLMKQQVAQLEKIVPQSGK